MANLYSQYASGLQFTAGVLAGSSLGVSGLNPVVDRLNSIAPSDNLVSGTNLPFYGTFGNLAAGEGINIGAGSVITGEDASITNKGVAKFAAGEGIDVFASAGTITYAGENATTTNKGVASFTTADFTVSTGVVSLKNKTSYWSVAGQGFMPQREQSDYNRGYLDGVMDNDDGDNFTCPVQLPQGAIVTLVLVYGSDSTNTFYLYRRAINSAAAASAMAFQNVNTQDTSISSATIDNSSYCYYLRWNGSTGDECYGARINYTTDYD